MTNVKMKALDTLNITSVKNDKIEPDEEFVVPSYVAENLEERGLAEALGDAGEAAEDKPEIAPIGGKEFDRTPAPEPAPAVKSAPKPKPAKAAQ